VDAIFINRILPTDISLDFFDQWLLLQSEYIRELEEIFGSIRVYRIKWYDIEIAGMGALDRMIEDVLVDDKVLEVQSVIRNEEYEKTENGYQLKVYLPCAKKEEILMHETGTDIVLRIGNFKRSIPLPNALRRYRVNGAKILEQYLWIQFVPQEGGSENE
jgi:arsenite-transporting ATPase